MLLVDVNVFTTIAVCDSASMTIHFAVVVMTSNQGEFLRGPPIPVNERYFTKYYTSTPSTHTRLVAKPCLKNWLSHNTVQLNNSSACTLLWLQIDQEGRVN